MNWGKGLAIAMAAFIVFIVVLVTIIMRQKVDLVSDDYYSKELVFQNQIDALAISDTLVKMRTAQTDNELTIYFASNIQADSTLVELIRPSNIKLDITYTVHQQNAVSFPMKSLVRGKYDLTCTYWSKGKTYMQKEEVFIQ